MREQGFYWVKWCGEWKIGEYAQGDWYLTQCLSYLSDADMEEIDENKIERDPYPASHKLGYTPDQL